MKTQQEAVKKGDVVSVEYTGKLGDGEVFDSSTGREPLHFAVGSGQVIPGFDKAVDGMKKGESKKVTILCAEAYGPINTELLKEIPREKIPLKEELKAGMMLMMQGPDGQRLPVRVANVTPKTVTLDMNHPLAGKNLIYQIKIIKKLETDQEKTNALLEPYLKDYEIELKDTELTIKTKNNIQKQTAQLLEEKIKKYTKVKNIKLEIIQQKTTIGK